MYSSDDADLYSFHTKATFISETVNMDTSVSLQCTDIYIYPGVIWLDHMEI